MNSGWFRDSFGFDFAWGLILNKISGFGFVVHNVFVVPRCFLIQVRNMTWQKFMEDQFIRLVLIFWFVSSFIIMLLLGQLDWLVHNELYDFGLEFSAVWAQPYWATVRLIHLWLVSPSVLGAIALGFDFWKQRNGKERVSRSVGKPAGGKVQPLKGNSMVISCPSCKKTFGKPLVVLDFGSGKAKLVNVCPYCNAKLGVANGEDEKDFESVVLGPDEKVKVR